MCVAPAFMKGSSLTATFMAMEYLLTLITGSTMESGRTVSSKGLECSYGPMVTGIKGSISTGLNTGKECSSLQTEKYSRGRGRMGKNMERGNSS